MLQEIFIPLILAVLGGAIRVGTPFLFVSLGECLTETSGRINLGLEGVLVFSASTLIKLSCAALRLASVVCTSTLALSAAACACVTALTAAMSASQL